MKLGWGGDAITATVHLVKTTPPFQDIELLGVDTGGHNDERPRVVWSGPNVLRVTVGLYSYLKVLTRKAEGVQVDLHFDPVTPRPGRPGSSRPIRHPT